MNQFKKSKKVIGMFLFIVLIVTTFVGCSSSTAADVTTDMTKFFASISRIERETPQGLKLTKEQAEQLLTIINPVVGGMPLTPDLAETMLKDAENLLNKEQLKMIEDTKSKLGTPTEGMTPGSDQGPGNGSGTPGNGTPGSGANGGTNMFIRLDETITENYLK
ncbi:hypothetical protein [Tepidibacillus fermentans]|uniref:Lipoprotein n=1 Tax=Tepidibacillus fermentans TaxID=1281767 RepID=A0A4R3KM89_9BACI|nr:hypothetical protein [Tepidibacillus fermentans]TCS84586.1 hypothetical protein EDD72_101255 [Tepidibacillus fermentans]